MVDLDIYDIYDNILIIYLYYRDSYIKAYQIFVKQMVKDQLTFILTLLAILL